MAELLPSAAAMHQDILGIGLAGKTLTDLERRLLSETATDRRKSSEL